MSVALTNFIVITSLLLASCGGGGSDDGGGASTSNSAPVLAKVAVQYTNKNTAKDITLSASDSDNDVITFEARSQIANVSLSIDGNTLTVTPSPDWTGSSTITVEVSDGILSHSGSFSFTTLEVSNPPILSVSDNGIPTPPPIPTF